MVIAVISSGGGCAVAVVVFAVSQTLLGLAWGLVCRVLDCTMADFANPWVIVPLSAVSLAIGIYVGWLSGPKMYRSLQGLSRA